MMSAWVVVVARGFDSFCSWRCSPARPPALRALQESAVGFDTAVKVYSQLVGNTAIDGASARKYWYFMRLMGQVRGVGSGGGLFCRSWRWGDVWGLRRLFLACFSFEWG